jgi:competence protein ComEC
LNRSILLTGDVEGSGLQNLLAASPRKYDVLLSPHHGSKASNSEQLFLWGDPDYLVVSGRTERLPHLQSDVGHYRLLNTATSGAVTFSVDQEGVMQVEEFLPARD